MLRVPHSSVSFMVDWSGSASSLKHTHWEHFLIKLQVNRVYYVLVSSLHQTHTS